MEHQYQFTTRGIYRPNAQRLSISLAPLVAQRSLLFRVRADLNSKAHYGELTPTTGESDLELFALTASTAYVLTALMSVASAVSAASVYSQDSWKGGPSPFATRLQTVDTKRHAIAFSPDVNWSDLNEDTNQANDTLEEEMVEVPLRSAISEPEAVIPKVFNPSEVLNSVASNAATPPISTTWTAEVIPQNNMASVKLQKRRKTMADASKRTTKHSNAFSKVMGRISLQPSKKEISALEKRQVAMDISNPMPKLKLSDLKPIETNVTGYKLPELKTPGPIRMSFIVGPKPQAPVVPVLAPLHIPPPAIAVIAEDEERAARAKEFERRRLLLTTTPITPSWRCRSLTPPPPITPAPVVAPQPVNKSGRKRLMSTPAVMNFDYHGWDEERTPAVAPQPEKKKGHRRFKSSPAVMNFDFSQKRNENIPPMPPMPANLPFPMKLAPAPTPEPGYRRVRSLSLAGRAPNTRAVPPLPLPQARLDGSF